MKTKIGDRIKICLPQHGRQPPRLTHSTFTVVEVIGHIVRCTAGQSLYIARSWVRVRKQPTP